MRKGQHHSKETKDKMKKSWNHKLGCQCSVCKQARGELIGEKNPRYGKHNTEISKRKFRESLKKTNANKTEEEKAITSKKLSKALKRRWAKINPEDKKKLFEKITNKRLETWKNKSEEEMQEIVEKRKSTMEKKTPEEERLRYEKWKKSITKTLANKTPEEKQETSKKLTEALNRRWTNMTPEELADFKNKISNTLTDWDFYEEYGMTRKQYPYGPEFNPELKEKIAERDNFTCQMCGEVLPLYSVIHHIDHNPTNNNPENLQFLCLPCHTTHHKNTKRGDR